MTMTVGIQMTMTAQIRIMIRALTPIRVIIPIRILIQRISIRIRETLMMTAQTLMDPLGIRMMTQMMSLPRRPGSRRKNQQREVAVVRVIAIPTVAVRGTAFDHFEGTDGTVHG